MSILDTLITDRTGGYYNATDLNRVGEAVAYIGGLLNFYGYLVNVAPKADWEISDIPREEQMVAYLHDLQTIKAAFYGTTPLPATMNSLGYVAANNIEKLLLEIEVYINRMIAGFRYAGDQYAGEEW
jgi:hypothetical protein